MEIKLKAPAKINVTLDVLKKTAEGYHEIATILQQIPLFDELIFEEILEPKIIIQCNHPDVPTGPENLIYQAVKILEPYRKSAHPFKGLKISLKKNIPLRAGLGGGSSDAAATLKAVNFLWKLKLSLQKLRHLGANIGIDVPFFIEGGTAYGGHYGEEMRRLPSLKLPHLLLVVPQKITKSSTAQQYEKIEQYPHGHQRAATRKLLKEMVKRSKSMQRKRNNFENISKNVQDVWTFFHNDFDQLFAKKFASFFKNMYELGAKKIHMAGSGPAFYAIFPSHSTLKQTFVKVKRNPKIKAYCFSSLYVENNSKFF